MFLQSFPDWIFQWRKRQSTRHERARDRTKNILGPSTQRSTSGIHRDEWRFSFPRSALPAGIAGVPRIKNKTSKRQQKLTLSEWNAYITILLLFSFRVTIQQPYVLGLVNSYCQTTPKRGDYHARQALQNGGTGKSHFPAPFRTYPRDGQLRMRTRKQNAELIRVSPTRRIER